MEPSVCVDDVHTNDGLFRPRRGGGVRDGFLYAEALLRRDLCTVSIRLHQYLPPCRAGQVRRQRRPASYVPVQVKEDMEKIAQLANSVRIYNIAVCYENAIQIMESAKANDMTVLMGLWMQEGDPSVFENEFEHLPEFMEKYGDIIEYVIVGNEPVFIEEIDVDEVLAAYNKTRAWLKEHDYPHKSSVAEVWPVWETESGLKLANALDFVCMNMQPYWEGFYAKCPSNVTDCTPAGLPIAGVLLSECCAP